VEGNANEYALLELYCLQPNIVLLAEPFSALDAHRRANVRHRLHKIIMRKKLTIILVTHDWNDVEMLADQVFVRHEGDILRRWPSREVQTSLQTAPSWLSALVGLKTGQG